MSIQAPQGILNIPNATLRVGKLAVDEVVGADTILNTVARNTILLVDDEAYHENKNWSLKLPNAWAGEFECNTASAGNYSEFNFYNEGASSNAQGYNLTFNDTAVQLRYDGTLLKTGTLASTITGTGVKKVRLMFERTILSVTVDGTLVFTHDDTVGPRPRVYSTTAGGFLNFFTDGGALKNLKIVNEKWMSDGTSNIAYVGGGEVAVGQALAFNRVSNVSQIKVDSNVVTEYTGPHDRPLREYPEINMTTATTGGYTASASIENNTTTHAAFNAFTSEGFNRWQNGGTRYDTNSPFLHTAGESTTDTDGTPHLGDWIQLQLPNKINLSRIRFSQHSTAPAYQPKSYVVLGSNDNTTWKLIHTQTNLPEASATTDYKAEDNFMTVGYYKYLRLVVKSLQTAVNQIIILRLQYYGHEEGSGSLDTTLKSVYNVPATTGTQLEVYYDAKDLDNGAVTSVTDLSPNTNNGTLSGDPQISNGAFVFDGSGDAIVSSGTSTSLDGNATFSISLWSKTNTVSSGSNALFMLGYSSANKSTGLRIDASTGKYRFFTTGGLSSKTSPTTALLNEWTHITLIHEGTSGYKFYVNGVFIDEITVDNDLSLDSNPRVALGNYIDAAGVVTGTASYDGSIANFRLYSKVLNADQVKELYDYQKDYFLGSKSQVTLYKGHLGVGVTEPSGQLELAGDERIQEYPPGPMDDYETLIPGHGVFCASASSDLGLSYTNPYDAFSKATSVWITADNSYSSGLATNVNTFQGVNGAWLKLKLPYKINLKRFKIQGRNGSNERFIDAILYASTDDNNWDQLRSIEMPASYDYATGVDFDAPNTSKYYNYFLIQITKVQTGTGQANYANIGEWKLFGTPGPTTLDKGSLSLTRSLDVPRVSRYDVDTETPRPEKLLIDLDTTVGDTGRGAIDISGRGNHLKPVNGGSFYSVADKAYSFDGTTGTKYEGAATGYLGGTNPFSVSIWFNSTDSSRALQVVFGLGNYSVLPTNTMTGLRLKQNGGLAVLHYSNDVETIDSDVFKYNTWNHFVYVFNGSTAVAEQKVYINGVDVALQGSFHTGEALLTPANANFSLGTWAVDNTNMFKGFISQPKLYNVALEPSEVQKLYRLGRTGRSMVISDTAVGIGKVPEAQLDVRGSARFTGDSVVGGVVRLGSHGRTQIFSDDVSVSTSATNIPITFKRGAFLIIARGLSNDDACMVAAATDDSEYVTGTINYLSRAPDHLTNDTLQLSWEQNSNLQIRMSGGSERTVSVTVIRDA